MAQEQRTNFMKASAAFAVGLWTGAVVVAAVAWFHYSDTLRSSADGSTSTPSELEAKDDQIRLLRRDQARLQAETQRLRETVSELKSNRVARAMFRMQHTARPPATESETGTAWMDDAVTAGDAASLPKLEQLATQGDASALEALALLADLDKAESLMRVWNSTRLDASASVKAARYLAATIELNPQGQQFLVGLPTRAATDARVLCATVDGLINPSFPTTLARTTPANAPPHFKPDFGLRARILDGLHGAVTDAEARACIEKAREELAARVAQAAAPTTQ